MNKSSPAAWLRAANPLHRSETRTEALRAARIGAVSAGLLALQSVISMAIAPAMLRGLSSTLRDEVLASMPSATPEEAATNAAVMDGMFQVLPMLVAGFSAIMALLLAGAAIVQWRKPNAVIPGILLAFCVYSLVNALAAQVNPLVRELHIPVWQQLYGLLSTLVHVVLLGAAFRGALRLNHPQLESGRAMATGG
jgi:hypothetical protein